MKLLHLLVMVDAAVKGYSVRTHPLSGLYDTCQVFSGVP